MYMSFVSVHDEYNPLAKEIWNHHTENIHKTASVFLNKSHIRTQFIIIIIRLAKHSDSVKTYLEQI